MLPVPWHTLAQNTGERATSQGAYRVLAADSCRGSLSRRRLRVGTRVFVRHSGLEMPAPPQPPFDSWPIQHRDDHYGYAWYCGDGLIVSHITTRHGTIAAAVAYHNYEERMLREHAPDCEQANGLFVIHDWRAMETYDAGARRVWQERMRERPKGYLRGSVVCVSNAGALLRMAVQAANLVASVVHTARVELTTDLDSALRTHNVSAYGPQLRSVGSR
jgi:hypothetical protein